MRWYPRAEIERLRRQGTVARDRNGQDVLTITLPEPGGAKIRENVGALEDATIDDWKNDPLNPYLRQWASGQGW